MYYFILLCNIIHNPNKNFNAFPYSNSDLIDLEQLQLSLLREINYQLQNFSYNGSRNFMLDSNYVDPYFLTATRMYYKKRNGKLPKNMDDTVTKNKLAKLLQFYRFIKAKFVDLELILLLKKIEGNSENPQNDYQERNFPNMIERLTRMRM